ncbi:hypothetical protein [Actinomadura litoris]|nr:hypothetical protein [Actinomadura litoris]
MAVHCEIAALAAQGQQDRLGHDVANIPRDQAPRTDLLGGPRTGF